MITDEFIDCNVELRFAGDVIICKIHHSTTPGPFASNFSGHLVPLHELPVAALSDIDLMGNRYCIAIDGGSCRQIVFARSSGPRIGGLSSSVNSKLLRSLYYGYHDAYFTSRTMP